MKLWLCMFAGGDNMKSDYSFDDDVTQAASFVSPQQTAVSTENSDLFTSFPLLLFFSILCWSCGCVWSTFRDSVAWILEKTLSLPLCLILSLSFHLWTCRKIVSDGELDLKPPRQKILIWMTREQASLPHLENTTRAFRHSNPSASPHHSQWHWRHTACV